MRHISSDLAEFLRERAAEQTEHTEDPRCAQAAAALDDLADYIDTGEPATSTIDALELHLADGVLGGEYASREIALYGFGHAIPDPTSHLEFLDDLWVACMQDAYSAAGDEAEASDALWPCEVDAARRRVELEERYWERRSHMPEAECEQWIAEVADNY